MEPKSPPRTRPDAPGDGVSPTGTRRVPGDGRAPPPSKDALLETYEQPAARETDDPASRTGRRGQPTARDEP